VTGRLHGKVAVVTGAGSVGPGWGNGRAAAVVFAGEGARVLAVDRSEEALEETLAAAVPGTEMVPYLCDVPTVPPSPRWRAPAGTPSGPSRCW